MNSTKSHILICQGSKCKKKKSKKLLKTVEKFVKKNELQECIFFKESKCLSQCKKAPVICISKPTQWLYKQDKKEFKKILKKKFI